MTKQKKVIKEKGMPDIASELDTDLFAIGQSLDARLKAPWQQGKRKKKTKKSADFGDELI